MAAERAPGWVDPVMRAGYGARGGVYLIVGVLAALAVWRGGQAQGTKGALAQVADDPWGIAALSLIAVGLFAYALWRAIDAFMDLESHGTGAKGVVARGGMIVTGLVHLALGVYCFSLVFGGGSGGGGSGAQGLTARLMSEPYGRWLVGLAGAATIGAGIYYWVKAFTEKYKRQIRATPTTEKLDPAMKAGLVAHGVVIAIIGGFLVYAAWTHDPSQAGGVGKAFDEIRSAAFGRVLLGLVALGLIGFAVFCFVMAVYRVLPRTAGADVQTLGGSVGEITGRAKGAARRAEGQARRAARKV